jgi:hypothetical protein
MPRYASYKGSFVYHASGSAGEPEYTGAKMLFSQASAPTGWTKITTFNDAGIRVTNTTATPGGSGAFSTQLVNKTVSLTGTMTVNGAATTISGPLLPAHTHDWSVNPSLTLVGSWPPRTPGQANYQSVVRGVPAPLQPTQLQAQPITADNSHTHPGTFPISFSTPVNVAVQYLDVIIAQKT